MGDLIKLAFFWTFMFGAVFAVVGYSISRDRPLLANVLSHWTESVPGLKGTTRDFYILVESKISEYAIPNVVVQRMTWHEAGILSDKREYLRVVRGDLSFDLCVAPFGNSLFVSSWLCAYPHPVRDFFARVPFIGVFVRGWVKLMDPDTYYRFDAASMFQGAVHNCVLEVLDRLTSEQGLDPLQDVQRKPVMRELYSKRAFAG